MKKLIGLGVALATLLAFVGCSKKESTDINIGFIGPLSGGVAVYGVECKNGVDLAVQEINDAGGVNGKKIVVISEDDEGNPDKSVNAFNKLTSRNGVELLIGSLTSGCTIAMTKFSQAKGVLQMAPAATAPEVTTAGNYIFRACYTDPFQGTVGGIFAKDTLQAKNVAILYDAGNDYSVGLYENFVKAFEGDDRKVVALESYTTGDKNFNAQLTKIKNANPDAIYLPDYYATVALITMQMRSLGMLETPIIGADGWDGLTEIAGKEFENGFYSNHYSVDSTEPAVQKFVASFQERYKKAPNSFAALGYDCVYMLRDAMIRAKSEKAKAVRDAMEKTDGNYVTGHLTFDENRNPIKSAVMLELVMNGNQLTTKYKTTVNP